MRIAGIKSILLVVVAILVVISAYFYIQDKHLRVHSDMAILLAQLQELDTRIDRDVLRISSFQLDQYDSLVETNKEVLVALGKLKNGGLGDKEDGVLQAEIQKYDRAVELKMALVERIKSRISVIKNSLRYIPILLEKLEKLDDVYAAEGARVFNYLLQYEKFKGRVARSDLDAMVKSFASREVESGVQQIGENLTVHFNAVLSGYDRISELYQVINDAGTREHFEELYLRHSSLQEKEVINSRRSSLIFLVVIVFLLMGLWIMLSRLDKARHLAEQSSTRLHDAVASLPEAFALFDADNRLVLSNEHFMEFYPWLRGKQRDGLTLDSFYEENAQHLMGFSLSGEKLSLEDLNTMGGSYYIEHRGNERWYLASNNETDEGGMVCLRSDITEAKKAEADLRKLSRALEQSPASVVITDTEGTIEYVNPKFEQASGYSAAEAIGQNPRMLKGGERSEEDYEELWQTLSEGKEWRGLFHNKRKDGSMYWESASISPIRGSNGEITHYVGVKEDVTERKKAEEQLRMNATVFDTTAEGIMVTDPTGRIKTVNAAFTKITGYEAEEVVGRTPKVLSSGRHDEKFYEDMWKALTQYGNWSGEIWDRRKDGTVYPEWLSIAAIRNDRGEINEYVAIFSDITQRKQSEEQILYQANYDVLTGLPNRTLLMDRLVQTILSARRDDWTFGLMFVDLDRFKIVNDSFGHVTGDELLQAVAERLKGTVRDVDTVARFGGDEFVVLVHGITVADDAMVVANKIIHAISEPFELDNRSVNIGASVGITLFPWDVSDQENIMEVANTLLSNADMAMYQAKSSGRSRYRFFQSSMQEQIKEHLALEQDLRRALENDEFYLEYQPIHEAYEGEIVAVEALLRWQHPERGIIMPGEFISLAEETGLIGPIGEWVFFNACRQVSEWHQREELFTRLTLNLSTRQRGLGFNSAKLARILGETGLPATALTLEITENLLLEESSEAIDWLNSFKDCGIKLSIDDFGTGYSSLGYLKRFPVDTLKIDRSFVMGLPDDTGDASLVTAIAAMADSLGIDIVAEGVETEAQWRFLRDIGCDHMQGYYFSKPVSPEEIERVYGRESKVAEPVSTSDQA